jgi:eukaryotic-like serine/threonine-protein kinase
MIVLPELMDLAPGKRLGPYEIVSRLGEGGMGEVWRARDTRLDRSVAVKVLPAELAQSAQLRVRFEREAKTISQLNHPHICTLYDVGEGYLVMELLEGQTLADRLARGGLPLADVVRYGSQIADALDKAHRKGIVHRDLKPANIMITPGGAKLLDFGLAKPAVVQLGEGDATAQKPLTAEGTILGTFQYMAPEQLEGQEADARTDIFALGAVLYEMATGRRAFDGKTKTSLIAAIVGGRPAPISSVDPVTPAALETVILRCLEKDPEDRWQSARDVVLALRDVQQEQPRENLPRWRLRSGMLAALAALAGLLLGVGGAVAFRPKTKPQPYHLSVVPPEGVQFNLMLALSPDGRSIAYRGSDSNGTSRLYLRRLDAGASEAMAGTEGASYPFWSPDSRSLGFFSGGKLLKFDTANGNVTSICEVGYGGGATWSADGTIVFASGLEGSLDRVSSGGGTPVPFTRLEQGEQFHIWPRFLPGGRHVLFFAGGEKGRRGIYTAAVATGERKLIIPAPEFSDITMVAYAGGSIYFVQNDSLFAQRLDPQKLEVSGQPVRIADHIARWGPGLMGFDVAPNGMLAYVRRVAAPPHQLIWYDRQGNELSRVGEPGPFTGMSLSADDDRVAVQIEGAEDYPQVWIIETRRGLRTRLTRTRMWNSFPRFSPDGQLIAWSQAEETPPNPFVINADGTGEQRRLLREPRQAHPSGWSPDGKWIICMIIRGNAFDLVAVPVEGGAPRELLVSDFNELFGVVSPDGGWLAYTSNDSGTNEVYVTAFPNPGRKWRISTAGGTEPVWNPRGGEILYYEPSASRIMAVRLGSGDSPDPEAPQPLLTAELSGFAVSRDGQRILANQQVGRADSPAINVLMNWRPDGSN